MDNLRKSCESIPVATNQATHNTNQLPTMKTTIQCLKIAAKGITTRRHLRLVRGTFDRLTAGLSIDLRNSALRTFDRIARANGTYNKY